MKIECMWCGKDMGSKPGYGVEGVTTSICDDCLREHYPTVADRLLPNLETELEDTFGDIIPVTALSSFRQALKQAFMRQERGVTW